jgi:ubiquinone/menaquinone biosynthesis C-methylase UbiE
VSQYVFDNAAMQTGQRFQSLEALYDPRTVRFLEATGIDAGWRCLEVGAGAGSIAAWLAERVGPSGHVLVSDIDPRYLEALAASGQPNVEVRRHDVGLDPLPEAAFDLVHARLVLIHVPQREAALARLVAALKPDGWIVVEDFDPGFIDRGFPATDPEGYAAYAAVRAAMGQVMERHGVDPVWGRSLYHRFVAHGLADVGLEGHFAVWPGGSAGALLDRANFEQVRAKAVAAGLVTDAQVDRAVTALDDPGFAFSSPVMMTAWGRKR